MGCGARMEPGHTAVVSSVLKKLQAERTLPAEDVRVFVDAAEAWAWLREMWSGVAA